MVIKMGEIQRYVAPESGIGHIGDALGAVNQALTLAHTYYGVKSAKTASDLMEQQNDVNSDYSHSRQADAASALNQMIQRKLIPAAQGSALLETLPKLSGAQVDSLVKDSPSMNMGMHQMTADAAAAKLGVSQARFGETQNQHSVDAGKAFEDDPIIKLSKTSLNSLKKSQSILENPDKPVTAKDLNLAYTDYINSVAAGGAATEGKIGRELPETFAQEFNALKGKYGQFDDLRKDSTGAKLIDMLHKNIATVRNDMQDAISQQAINRFQDYGANTNPKVQQIAKQKLKVYSPQGYADLFGGDVPDTSQAAATAAAPTPAANKTVAPHVTLDDIQAEIARRKGTKASN